MLGEMIREYRIKKELTQEQLGERIGVSAQAVSKWENNNALPDTALLPALADALDVTLDMLFERKVSGAEDTFRMIHRYHAAQTKCSFSTIWNLLYQSGIGFWGESFAEPPTLPETYTRLQYAYDDGFFHAAYGEEGSVLVAAPRPKAGWSGLYGEDAEIGAVLDALGDPETRRAINWLRRHEAGYRFLFAVLVRDSGIAPEAADKVRRDLLTLTLIRETPVVIDGVEQVTCRYWPRQQFTVIWLLLDDFIHRNTWFNFQSCGGRAPILKK
ncbi:MAG: helix-turn-helix transcriptional regulator [Clostridia bacterium]|nr:helix-turn-helix transcriptional regulator [Clostridia bacterium]